MNRSLKFTYKGIIMLTLPEDDAKGEVMLGVFYDKQIYFMSISDHNKNYDDLNPNEIAICVVEFQDGTEPVDFLLAKDKDFEDIFISIQDIATFEIDSNIDKNVYAYKIMNEKPLFWIPDIVQYVSEVFLTDDIIQYVELYKDWNEEWAKY